MEAIVGILVFIVCAVFWFIPLFVIAISSRTSGGEKLAWLLAVIFVSWFAWVFYFLLAPLKSERTSY